MWLIFKAKLPYSYSFMLLNMTLGFVMSYLSHIATLACYVSVKFLTQNKQLQQLNYIP